MRSATFFLEMIEFTLRTGLDGLTILPRMPFSEEPWEASFERAGVELAWRVAEARRHGLRLSVEPHHGSIVEAPETTERLAAVLGLELTLDHGHFTVQGIPDEQVEPLLEHARLVHLRPGREGLAQSRLNASTIGFDQIRRPPRRT